MLKVHLLQACSLFFVGAASIIYNIEHWSLIKRSGVHFIIMLITIYPILLLSGWFTITSVFDAVKIFILFAFVGIILWSLFFILARIFSWYIIKFITQTVAIV